MSAMDPLLAIRGLTTEYATYGGGVRAVDGVDLEVFAGELVGVVGVAAAGKSPLVASVLNLGVEQEQKMAGPCNGMAQGTSLLGRTASLALIDRLRAIADAD